MTVTNATESYADYNQAGRDYADALHGAVQQGLSAPKFASAMRTMIEGGEYGGFEVGFAFRLHALLLATVPAHPG